MPQNVLLHFPIVDLVCLQRSVREHTQRIVKFIREHNEYISKCKITDRESTLFPLYLTEVPNELSSSENISLSEDDIFSVVTGSNLNENDCTVRSDVIDENRDKTVCVINRVESSELNSFYREITSNLEWRNIEQDSGNLTTLSCPIRFPSEEKQISLRVPGFETCIAAPLSHSSKNSEKKYSEYICGLGTDIRKIESLPSSIIKSVKKEQCNIKMEPSNNFEDSDDEVVVIAVKKEKVVEVITLDDDEDNRSPQAEHSTRPVSGIPKPLRTAFEISEPIRFPPENLTPPSLTPEVSDPPCLMPEVMEPILTPESSQPPLIFPEIDPPLWSFSVSSPMISYEEAQPPILTPEVRDLVLQSEADGTVYHISDESQPPLISSEVLPPMLMNSEPSGNTYITLGDSESSQESVTVMDTQESVTVMDTQESVTVMDNQESVTVMDNQESVTVMDNQESVTFMDIQEPITVMDSQESITIMDTQESVTVMDTQESVTIMDTQEPLTIMDAQESVTVIDAQDSVTVMDAQEEPLLPVVTSVRSLCDFPFESTSDMTSFEQGEFQVIYTETVEQTVITPKKTNDITKIKGWKRKHFRVDTNESDELDEQPKAKKARKEKPKKEKAKKEKTKKEKAKKEKPKKGGTKKGGTKKGGPKKGGPKKGGTKKGKGKKGEETKKLEDQRQTIVVIDDVDKEQTSEINQKNAFVCDRLDKFLEGEADLKINYEVPHLFAEVGITLTKDDVVSKPRMTDEEYRKVVTKYCVKLKIDGIGDDKDEEDETSKPDPKEKKVVKKKLNESSKSSKARKLETSNKKEKQTSKKKKNSTIVKKKGAAQTVSHKPKPKKTKVTNQSERATSSEVEIIDSNGTGFDGNGPTKLIGVALYPGPKAPMPQLVQRHLDKIRSYQLTIDRCWAKFAASALVVPERDRYRRMILPVQYCAENLSRLRQSTAAAVPTEVKQVVKKMVDTVCKESSQQSTEVRARDKPRAQSKNTARLEEPKATSKKQPKTAKKTLKRDSKITECKIIVSKANEPSQVWCTKHNRYCCHPCGLDHDTQEERTSQPTEADFPTEFFVMSTPLKTNQDIASFLTNKLRYAEWNDVILNDIDNLRTIVPNSLEFINLSIVRDSFLSKKIYIWYLKPNPKVWNSARAFLTFSKVSPIPSAVRFRADSQNLEEMVPKIIMDMMTLTERNAEIEYAIMLCNDKVWELHGSLRYATHNPNPENLEKDCMKWEEFLILSPPSELEKISEAAIKVIKEPSVRWWVVDLTQKFTTIVSNLDSQTHIMTKQYILNHLKMKFFGFLILNKTSNRVIWVHVFPKILPYVLIGPFKLSESHGLTLKQGLNEIPFSYNPKSFASPKFPLKTLLNSVIAQTIHQERELKGVWLCERQQVDKTCYLEILTSSRENPFAMLEYDLDVEHGYTLKSLVNNQSLTVKRKVSQIVPKVRVYLYFDLFELGYITGNLFQDDTVMTGNPLNKRIVTIPSYAFGNWFICLLKEKIRFVPNTIKLKWYVTKHEEDLRGRKPFDLNYLNGSYMICGVGPTLELLDMKAHSGDFKRDHWPENSGDEIEREREMEREMVREIESEIEWERQREKEMEKERKRKRKAVDVAQLKKLENVLYGYSNGKVDMDITLSKAEDVIEKLEILKYISSLILRVVASKRIDLGSKFIELLDSVDLDDAIKIELFSSERKLFASKDSDELQPEFKEILLRHKFGRLYLILNGETELLNAEYTPPKRETNDTNDGKRRKKRLRDLCWSIIEAAVPVGSGDGRAEDSKATEAAKEKGQETASTSSGSSGETTGMEKSVERNTNVQLVSNQGKSNIGKNNNTQRARAVNMGASTSQGKRSTRRRKKFLFVPTLCNIKEVIAKLQRDEPDELIPILRTTTTTITTVKENLRRQQQQLLRQQQQQQLLRQQQQQQQQQPYSILKDILEHPNAATRTTEYERLSESLLVHPHLEEFVQEEIVQVQQEVEIEGEEEEEEEIDVVNNIEEDGFPRNLTVRPPSVGERLQKSDKSQMKTSARNLIQGTRLEQTQIVGPETFSLESTSGSTEIHIPENARDDGNNDSDEIMIFDPKSGCYLKMDFNQ